MKNVRSTLFLATAALLAVSTARGPILSVSAARADKSRLFHGVGVVREVDAEHGRLVVSHEDIPGLMPAMVMAFAVDPPSLARGLKPGDKIEFDVTAKTYIIKNLKPTGGGKK